MSCGCDTEDLGLPVGPQGDPGKGYDASSVTSIDLSALGSSVVIQTQSDKAYSAGSRIRVSDVVDPSVNFFEGIVSSYVVGTGVLTVDPIDVISGTATLASWNINIAGEFSGRVLFNSHSNVATVGVPEMDLLTYDMPAGTFKNDDRDVLDIDLGFQVTPSTNTKRLRFYFGGVVFDQTISSLANQSYMRLVASITRLSATSVKVELRRVLLGAFFTEESVANILSPVGSVTAVPDMDTLDTTIKITGEATTGPDVITSTHLIVKLTR